MEDIIYNVLTPVPDFQTKPADSRPVRLALHGLVVLKMLVAKDKMENMF
jgi:hypothetical protein